MYLSKLDLHGFKSFATPTTLHFAPGITAIVGPNGCGKSNIVDAVRWVIGEQRARILRSEKMENVIFNGTTKRRPLGLAEVQLTIENTRGVLPTEYSEVTLGRRLFRSGDSEYLLNGIPCRLKDIVDLFMDTGMGAGAYSVIELKMVEEILSDNADDRRHLFEEAAGITKYKLRRGQALRKLDNTQADLTRLRDLTEEIDKRVRSLKRQAAKAARHQAYEERLHELELALAQREHDRLRDQEAALDAEIARTHDDLEAHTARLAKDEADLEALRTTLVEREQTLSAHQQRLAEHEAEVKALEADARLEDERLEAARRERVRTLHHQEEDARQREQLQRLAERLAAEIEEAAPQREAAEARLKDAEAARDAARDETARHRAALDALRAREQQALDALTERRRTLDRLANRLDLLDQEQARLRTQLAALAEAGAPLDDRVAEADEALEAAADRRDEARARLQATEQAHTDARQRRDTANDRLHHLDRRHAAAEAEVQVLESLVASFDEFSDAVQFLAADAGWAAGPLRTVADVLTCDAAHRAALDAALGPLGSCLLVRDDDEALRAAHRLRADDKGPATFLVLGRLAAAPPLPPMPDVAGARPLHSLVRADDPAPGDLVRRLLHGHYLVASLDEARARAREAATPARFLAPTGEWAEADGWLHAGGEATGASPVSSRLARREQLETMQAQLAQLRAEREAAAGAVAEAEAARAALPLDAHRAALAEAEQDHAEAERIATRLTFEQETAAARRAELAEHLAELADERAAIEARQAPLAETATEAETHLETLRAEREAAETAFQEAEAAARAAQDRFSEVTVAAVEARNHHETLRRDRDRAAQDLDTLARRDEDRQVLLQTLQETLDGAQVRRDELRAQIETTRGRRADLEDGVARARTALLQTRADIDSVESRLRKLRQAREERLRTENAHAVRRAEIQTRKADLLESIADAFGRSLADDPVPLADDFDETDARAKVQQLRQRLKSLGHVNALALEEYEQEKERLDFMTGQMQDLEAAEATLRATIDEINTTASARFAETYDAIRASFQTLFGELFGDEAAADLALADPDDPLESAIDIIARPRGKRPVSISQLSSGEKTLTAIALLFAIYLVKPSPFCLLDEVDAPLDDANVDRFMHLIRRFATDTQFILVTHNKRTMELADRLYGITMQEQGVSRLVGVRFDEALALAV